MTEQNLFSELTHPKKEEILHIEIGAGKGNFGKRYYPECLLTDKDPYYIQYYIDLVCDAIAIPKPDASFKKIIICNPFHYGFRYTTEGESLLKEFLRVLNRPGEIIIIGRKSNPYCTRNRIEKSIQAFPEIKNKISYSEINSSVQFSDYTFFRTDGRITQPDFMVNVNVD